MTRPNSTCRIVPASVTFTVCAFAASKTNAVKLAALCVSLLFFTKICNSSRKMAVDHRLCALLHAHYSSDVPHTDGVAKLHNCWRATNNYLLLFPPIQREALTADSNCGVIKRKLFNRDTNHTSTVKDEHGQQTQATRQVHLKIAI